jgi:hypothetical protein
MSENRVLRRIFEPKRDEVTGKRRKLHIAELNDLYSSDIFGMIKSRRMRWAGHVAHMGDRKGAYKFLVGKPEGKRLLVRTMRRWEDNNKMDLQKMGSGGMDWIDLAQDRDRWWALVNEIMKASGSIKWGGGDFFTNREPVSFSRRTILRGVSKRKVGNPNST